MKSVGVVAGVALALAAGARAQDGAASRAARVTEWFRDGAQPEIRFEIADEEMQLLRKEPKGYVRATVVVTESRPTGDARQGGRATTGGGAAEGGAVGVGTAGGDATEGTTTRAVVGVKLKGSFGSFRGVDLKPGWTVDWDRLEGGTDFHGLRKFHLNNAAQDPSYLRELLAYATFREAGLAAPLVTHAHVTLNGKALGLYVLKEGYDQEFLARSFGTSKGNLYDGGTNGDVGDDLERDEGDGPLDRADLRAVAAACAERDAGRRREKLAVLIDLDRFASFVALELLLDHWDGYALNPNNFRLWFAPEGGRGVFIPHGTDQIYRDAAAQLFEPLRGTAAAALFNDAAGRAALRARIKELAPAVSPAARPLAIVNAAAARLLPFVARTTPAAFARRQRAAVGRLRGEIEARARFVAEEIARPEPVPFDVAVNGGSLAALPWAARPGCADVRCVEAATPAGGKLLVVRAGACGACTGAWRAKVLLPAGRYVLTADVAVTGVVASDDAYARGACVRISGLRGGEGLVGTAEGRAVRFAFEVKEALATVEVILELRAKAGEARFELASVRLARE